MIRKVLGWLTLAAASWLAGCASTSLQDENLPPTLVTRTSDSTVWTTAEAEAAAAAAAAAPRRPATRTAPPPAPLAKAAAVPAAAPSTPSAPPEPVKPVIAADAGAPARLIYFNFDSFDIKDEFSAAIESHARILSAERSRRMVIEGHADERGGAEYNLALGQKRAHAVARALLLLGVNDSQVEAVSFGDARPLARGQNEEAWAQNRRAELKDR